MIHKKSPLYLRFTNDLTPSWQNECFSGHVDEKISHCSNLVGSEPKDIVSDFPRLGISHLDLFTTCLNMKCTCLCILFEIQKHLQWMPFQSIGKKCGHMRFLRFLWSKVSQENSRGGVLSVSDCSPVGGSGIFSSLLSILVAPPINLPCSHDLLIQIVSWLFHLTPGICRLHAWLLCNNVCKRQNFWNSCQKNLII